MFRGNLVYHAAAEDNFEDESMRSDCLGLPGLRHGCHKMMWYGQIHLISNQEMSAVYDNPGFYSERIFLRSPEGHDLDFP